MLKVKHSVETECLEEACMQSTSECNVSHASMCHMMSANQQQLCLQCADVVDHRRVWSAGRNQWYVTLSDTDIDKWNNKKMTKKFGFGAFPGQHKYQTQTSQYQKYLLQTNARKSWNTDCLDLLNPKLTATGRNVWLSFNNHVLNYDNHAVRKGKEVDLYSAYRQ